MPSPYDADIRDAAGNVRISGEIAFTDPDNQPGGAPAGNDGAIQFNDNGAFGGDDALIWDAAGGNGTIKLVTTANGIAGISANALGVQLQIEAGDGDASHVGGEVTILSGGSAGFGGGQLLIEAGTDSADGDGGAIAISSGNSVAGDGGDIDIKAHSGLTAGDDGGNITIRAGAGTNGGGNTLVQGGGPDGNVQLYSGDGNQYVQLDNDGLQVGATKLGFFQGAAVVQPTAVAVDAASIHAALVSLGLITGP